MGFIDLHLHSIFSDGSETPEALLAQAETLGLRAVSITDHDSTGAYSEKLRAAFMASPVRLITGVELSARDNGCERHVLGYCFHAETLNIESLSGQDRERRNLAILDRLDANGIHITMEELRQKKPVGSIGRPHIAAILVERGLFPDTFSAFDALLSEGRPCYVPRELFTLESAAEAVRTAGGKAVLAHPFQYGLSETELDRLFCRCADCGYYGIEAYYSGYSAEDTAFLGALAAKYRLRLTGGSDFHGISRPERKLGGAFVPDYLLEDL